MESGQVMQLDPTYIASISSSRRKNWCSAVTASSGKLFQQFERSNKVACTIIQPQQYDVLYQVHSSLSGTDTDKVELNFWIPVYKFDPLTWEISSIFCIYILSSYHISHMVVNFHESKLFSFVCVNFCISANYIAEIQS